MSATESQNTIKALQYFRPEEIAEFDIHMSDDGFARTMLSETYGHDFLTPPANDVHFYQDAILYGGDRLLQGTLCYVSDCHSGTDASDDRHLWWEQQILDELSGCLTIIGIAEIAGFAVTLPPLLVMMTSIFTRNSEGSKLRRLCHSGPLREFLDAVAPTAKPARPCIDAWWGNGFTGSNPYGRDWSHSYDGLTEHLKYWRLHLNDSNRIAYPSTASLAAHVNDLFTDREDSKTLEDRIGTMGSLLQENYKSIERGLVNISRLKEAIRSLDSTYQ